MVNCYKNICLWYILKYFVDIFGLSKFEYHMQIYT